MNTYTLMGLTFVDERGNEQRLDLYDVSCLLEPHLVRGDN